MTDSETERLPQRGPRADVRPEQAKPPRKPKTTLVSIRLTDEERSRLTADAGSRSLSEHIRARLFGGEHRPRRAPNPTSTSRDAAQALAVLGQSEIASSLRTLAHAAKVGALPVTPETEADIQSACKATTRMRTDLMQALGLKEGPP